MTVLLPAIYGLSINNIKQKIDFYRENNLEFIILNYTKQLIQSTKLSYARLMFFDDKGIKINSDNYKRIFIGQKQFEKQYGVNNATLCEMYKYEVEVEKNKNKVN